MEVDVGSVGSTQYATRLSGELEPPHAKKKRSNFALVAMTQLTREWFTYRLSRGTATLRGAVTKTAGTKGQKTTARLGNLE